MRDGQRAIRGDERRLGVKKTRRTRAGRDARDPEDSAAGFPRRRLNRGRGIQARLVAVRVRSVAVRERVERQKGGWIDGWLGGVFKVVSVNGRSGPALRSE